MRGVSYFVARGDPIKKVIASESVVHAAASSSMGSWGKGGVNKWSHQLRIYIFKDAFACSYLYY